jgi:zinc protease
MKNLCWVVCCSFVLCVVVAERALAAATADSASATSVLPVIPYEKYTLGNGLDVILTQDHSVPLVSVNIWYHVGPANERPGRTGFAHLFEHMMFQGSQHVEAKAFDRYLEAAGATDFNGTTDFDHTKYFETVPSNQLELALWLESDRMGFLLPKLDREKLANQRDVVRNERRQTTENVPYGLVEEEIYHQLFPPGFPYYGAVIGSHADVEAARLGDVREFFRQYYSPNNASLVIAGDFDPVRTKALIAKYFGSIPRGPAVPRIEVKTSAITSQRRATVTDTVELPRVYVAWLTPSIYQPGDAESDLLARILGGGKTSRLYRKLVYEKQIAQDVDADNESLLLGSVFLVQATAKPGVKIEDLEKAMDEEIQNLREKGVTKEELARAVNVHEASTLRRLESSNAVADRLNEYNHYLGDPGYLPKDLARYQQVTLASLKRAADAELSPTARVVVYGIPGEKVIHDVPKTSAEDEIRETAGVPAVASGPDEPWRASPPSAATPVKFTPPLPVRFELPSGLTVLLVERHKLPIISANLVTLAGTGANPAGKPGLASFTADMLDQGTERSSSLAFAADVERIGATLDTGAGWDTASLSLRTLTRNVDAGFELLSAAVLHPGFDPAEIERERSERLADLLQDKEDPGTLRNDTLNRVLYGKSSYGYDVMGTEESTKSLTRDDLVGFWKQGFVPPNAALIVAGDITEKQLRALAEKYFGKWKGSASVSAAPAEFPHSSSAIYIVDEPGAPQTSLAMGAIGARRDTPDFVAMNVMNMVFGGQFASRINMNLREEHGYTYGAHSGFAFRRGPGPFSAYAEIRTDVTAPALHELYREVGRIRDSDVSPQELKLAKDSWALSLAGDFETTGDIAASEAGVFVYGLPLDYYRTLPSEIEAVTASDVHRVALKYINPDSLIVVAVGDRARIGPEIEKLGLAPVKVAP